MAEQQDPLSTFDFDQVTTAGLYLKFSPGDSVIVRILTTDPVISESEFTDKTTGEVRLNTRFAFIVYNFTDKRAQIMQATANTAKEIGKLHNDPDFGANIQKVDLKITPPNKNEIKAYDIQVLPSARPLSQAMIDEAKAIDLDNNVKDSRGRMSVWVKKPANEPEVGSSGSDDEGPGKAAARETAEKLKASKEPVPEDIVIEDIGDEPINLDDIPF